MNPVSIMMVTYNRLELTKQTLESLLAHTDVPFELIIVDNASQDKTTEYLKEYLPTKINNNFVSFTLHENEANLGIAIGRNQCLNLAKGEWLSTVDNDVVLFDGLLSQAIEILSKNPMYGMIGVNMEDVSYPLVTKNGTTFQHKERGNLGTACTVFHRKLHKLLGYFNHYSLYGEEDADMGMRIRVLGLKLGYLKQNGIHLGQGENDIGEYREFKTASHQANLKKFNENCAAYVSGRKPIYIPFKQ
jgi:glycosyltransferase involved in cell wall biosynthesis